MALGGGLGESVFVRWPFMANVGLEFADCAHGQLQSWVRCPGYRVDMPSQQCLSVTVQPARRALPLQVFPRHML